MEILSILAVSIQASLIREVFLRVRQQLKTQKHSNQNHIFHRAFILSIQILTKFQI